jgi:hypothetical protein
MGSKKGKRLFKSKSKIIKFKMFFYAAFSLIGVLMIFLIPTLSLPKDIMYLIGFLLYIPVSVGSFLLLLYFLLTFLKIYENGIVFRRPSLLTFLIPKYIPYEEITDAEITKEKRRLKIYRLKQPNIDREYTYWFLRIFFKSSEPVKIDREKASNYREALKLILKNKKG